MRPPTQCQRCHLSVAQKLMLIEWAHKPCWKQQRLADWAIDQLKLELRLSRHAVGRIIRSEAKLRAVPIDRRSCMRVSSSATFNEFDRLLATRVDDMEDKIGTVTGELIVTAAEDLAVETAVPLPSRPNYSNGWLYKFQKRWGSTFKRKHGESASVTEMAVRDGRTDMLALTRQYPRDNVYNMDEISSFYQADQSYTISRKKKVAGRKQSRVRMTLALAVNATGTDKLKPLFIGTAKNPRVLKGHNVDGELGVNYTNSKKAWMNSDLFRKWILDVDKGMKARDRHILLRIDNASAHPCPDIEMTHVRLEFLPKNMTSVLQPLDQGIIAHAKRAFNKIKARRAYNLYKMQLPPKKVDVLDAMEWAKEAWDAVKPVVIQNRWYHAGIIVDPRKVASVLNPLD